MKNILVLLLFAASITLTSCSKADDNLEPTCEQGGEEVTP